MNELQKIYNFYEPEEDNREQEFIRELDKRLSGESLEIWLLLRQGIEEKDMNKILGISYYQFKVRLKNLSKEIKKYGDSFNYR